MNIKATKTAFDYFGRFCFRIDLGDGVKIDNEALVLQAMHFSNIIIFAKDESLEESKDIQDFAKRLYSANQNCEIEVFTKGIAYPLQSKNVKYTVALLMKSSGMDFGERIVGKNITQHFILGSKFLFYIDNEDDMDEIMMITTEYQIPKQNIYLCFENEGHIAYKYAKQFGLNLLYLANYNKGDDDAE
jgi:hypothetical protein